MSDEEIEGQAKKTKGKIREAAGVIVGDKEMQAKGKMEKTEGKAEETIGRVKRKVTHDEDI